MSSRRPTTASVRAFLVHHHLSRHLAVNLGTTVPWRHDQAWLERDTVRHGPHALVGVHVTRTHAELAHLLHSENTRLSTEP